MAIRSFFKVSQFSVRGDNSRRGGVLQSADDVLGMIVRMLGDNSSLPMRMRSEVMPERLSVEN